MLLRHILLTGLLAIITGVRAQQTLLDPTFGDGGMVLLGLSGVGGDRAEDVAELADGRIVVAGAKGGVQEHMIVLRLLSDGTLDASFGNGGVGLADFGGNSEAHALAVQPDGAIVLAGDAEFPGVFDDLALARFTAGGQLDPTFSGDGKRVFTGPGANDALLAVSIAPGGLIVASGKNEGGQESDMVALRLTASGEPDPDFSVDGIFRTDSSTGEIAEDQVIRPDGGIVLCGVWRLSLPNADLAMLQLTSAGVADPSFGVGGLFRPEEALTISAVTSAIGLADGRILIAGRRFWPGGINQELFTGRVLADGSWDTSYGTDGRSFLPLGDNEAGSMRDMVLLPDGKALVAVDILNGTTSSLMAMRVMPDGGLDASFGDNGRVQMPCPGDGCTAQSLALDAEGRVLVAGSYTTTVGRQLMVMRWLAEPSWVGTAEVANASGSPVYPLPTTGDLVIGDKAFAQGIQRAELLDGAGRPVHVFERSELLAGVIRLPALLADGAYVLRVTTANAVVGIPVMLRR